MSGHSKWSTIKRKKGAADQKRGKVFTRVIHEITTAVRESGADPGGNPKLRLALDKAKSVNMPNDTVERAMKRASGELKGEAASEVTYEGYGPGGAAILVEVLTDNKNRTAGEVRHAFTRCGGALGEAGCVSWMFERKGVLTIKRGEISEEDLVDLALGAGGEDVREEGEFWEVTCEPGAFEVLRKALETRVRVESAELSNLPKNLVSLNAEQGAQLIRLLEILDDMDDVLNVFSNGDFVTEG